MIREFWHLYVYLDRTTSQTFLLQYVICRLLETYLRFSSFGSGLVTTKNSGFWNQSHSALPCMGSFSGLDKSLTSLILEGLGATQIWHSKEGPALCFELVSPLTPTQGWSSLRTAECPGSCEWDPHLCVTPVLVPTLYIWLLSTERCETTLCHGHTPCSFWKATTSLFCPSQLHHLISPSLNIHGIIFEDPNFPCSALPSLELDKNSFKLTMEEWTNNHQDNIWSLVPCIDVLVVSTSIEDTWDVDSLSFLLNPDTRCVLNKIRNSNFYSLRFWGLVT